MLQHINVENPKYVNKYKTLISCDVKFVEITDGPIPFTASKTDSEAHSRIIFDECVKGKWGKVQDYKRPDDLVGEKALSYLRQKRDELLKITDLMVLPDRWNAMSEEKQKEWTEYRQALRDMPRNNPNVVVPYDEHLEMWVGLDNVTWPKKPS